MFSLRGGFQVLAKISARLLELPQLQRGFGEEENSRGMPGVVGKVVQKRFEFLGSQFPVFSSVESRGDGVLIVGRVRR